MSEITTLCNVKIAKKDEAGLYVATGVLKEVPIIGGEVDVKFRFIAETADDAEAGLYALLQSNEVITLPKDPQGELFEVAEKNEED